jgi:16S rRNA (adenine1518-N6/adenine1519-N6)-dimethyltransferase
MVQSEVAHRIVAEAGTSAYGALAVGVQSVASARLCFGVSRNAFRPVPNVDSAVVEIIPHHPPRLSVGDEEALRTLTRASFQWRRKQMQKILRDHPDLDLARDRVRELADRLALDFTRRPETFAPPELLALAREVAGSR